MSNPTTQSPNSDERLKDIVLSDKRTHDKSCGVTITGDLGNCDCNKSEHIAALKSYILAEVLEIVGPHVSLSAEEIKGGRIYRLGDPQGDAIDRYKDQLCTALTARFGGKT